MQAVLVMFRSDGERRSFSITRDVTVIGRREDCDLRIPLGDISRKHARLLREPEGMRLEDFGSSNGTYLNGQRVEREAMLQAGDSIQVGPVVFVLQIDGHPADEDLHPITAESAADAAMMAPSAVPTAPGMAPIASHEDELEALEPLPAGEDATLEMGHGGGDAGLELIEEHHEQHAPIPMHDEPLELVDEPLELIEEQPAHDHIGGPSAEEHGIDDLMLEIEPEPPQKRH
jgi:predicted component of type VI protein secretion system